MPVKFSSTQKIPLSERLLTDYPLFVSLDMRFAKSRITIMHKNKTVFYTLNKMIGEAEQNFNNSYKAAKLIVADVMGVLRRYPSKLLFLLIETPPPSARYSPNLYLLNTVCLQTLSQQYADVKVLYIFSQNHKALGILHGGASYQQKKSVNLAKKIIAIGKELEMVYHFKGELDHYAVESFLLLIPMMATYFNLLFSEAIDKGVDLNNIKTDFNYQIYNHRYFIKQVFLENRKFSEIIPAYLESNVE